MTFFKNQLKLWAQKAAGTDGRVPANLLIIGALGLILVALAGYLLFDQFSSIQDGIGELGKRLSLVDKKLDEVQAVSEDARQTARQAGQTAELAVQGRMKAENDRNQALEDAESARTEATQAREEAERIRREREEELNRLQGALSKIVETRKTALGLVMSLGSDSMQFDFNQATLRPENRELLSRIAGILLTSEGFGVYVYGHTDDVGSEVYNLELSKMRAETVRDYLVDAGINSDIITTKGFGKSNPVVPGNTPEARSKNRRVEIGIVNAAIQFREAVPDQKPH